ncbi:MAG: tetratricopeptide repeat protein [Desulfuromonadales bacterium]|nr:tetratricopeptide repeat protein [Desulfuromonadales bacterium]MDW7757743.1 tetratricopeptide repeat protein [Desulfuromonadales bacterium]
MDLMMGTKRKRMASCLRWSASRVTLVAVLGGMALGGCAAVGKSKEAIVEPSPVVAVEAMAESAGPGVRHFTDGREGFVISEPSTLNTRLRAEFDEAVTLIQETQYDQAIDALKRVVAQAPEISAPRINLAIAYRLSNQPEQAESELKTALELIEGHPVASHEYGLLLRQAGRFAEARVIYENALDQFPEYYPLHRNLGILCDLYLKDLACAVSHYESYSKAVPKNDQVKLWIADLNARLGR